MDINDTILIYENTTPMVPEGSIAKILDKSGDDPTTVLAATLEDIGEVTYKNRHDPNSIPFVLMAEKSFWVNLENCEKLCLEKPKPWWKRIFKC